MHNRHPFFLVLIVLFFPCLLGAVERRTVSAQRIAQAPVIDGQLTEPLWQTLPLLDGFVQYIPRNGEPASQRSEVRVGYDDEALYIGAMLYDDAPDSVLTELSNRDNLDDALADQFSVHISPYDDGANSYYFWVSASDVQADRRYSATGSDDSWDAVWQSHVSRNAQGWCVEIRIPYSALRFPKTAVQNWGFNCFRLIKRIEEWSAWNPVPIERAAWWFDMGRLEGLKDLAPPMRLSFTPYVSGYAERDTDDEWGSTYKGGMDVKYGITDGFTLDMTLIPDFGQVQSDDKILNLSPFETHYAERRPFFTEGMDLFSKGGLFYSRRIGALPTGYYTARDQLNPNEVIADNPTETRMINATKVSGRTRGGLGIGVFNAMTAQAEATARDTLNGDKRKIVTQPFTNYSLAVVDQALKNNGYVALINSNVSYSGHNANVVATDFRLATHGNRYAISGQAAISRVEDRGDVVTGGALSLDMGKVSGQWRYGYEMDLLSDTYDQNDLGYMTHNNFVSHEASLNYNIYKPFGPFLNWYNSLNVATVRRYRPDDFIQSNISFEMETRLKNQWRLNMHASWTPAETHDFYEARVPGRQAIYPKNYHNCGGLITDTRKPFYMALSGGFTRSYDTPFDRLFYSWNVEPYLRLSDRFTLGFDASFANRNDDIGWVATDAATGNIYFGRRVITTQSHTLVGLYRFSSKANLTVRLRHYNSKADHDGYLALGDDGHFETTDYTGDHDLNYNTFNAHTQFTWNFAPGSELVLAWKQEIETLGTAPDKGYFRNLQNTLDAPQLNSFSLKVLYYLDWHALKCRSKH